MTVVNPKAIYTCVNYEKAYIPKGITKRAICLNAYIGTVRKQ